VIKYGGISEHVAKNVRSSEHIRAQPDADATQMEHAQERAILRDFGNLKGTNLIPQFTLASIPNEVVVASASKLGVSLGKSPSQIESSIASIKNLDLERSLIMLKRKEEIAGTIDEWSSSFTLYEASRLSKDLEESDCIVGENIEAVSLRGKRNKAFSRGTKKKVADGLGVRRSSRLKKKI
jgi:hypothetical protein